MLVCPARTLGLKVCTPKGTCSLQGFQRNPTLSTHSLYTEKSLNTHLFPINVFICTHSWSSALAKEPGSHWGSRGYHHTPWGLLRGITTLVSSLYKSRLTRLTKCLFSDSRLHIQCLQWAFQSQKIKKSKDKKWVFLSVMCIYKLPKLTALEVKLLPDVLG